MKKSTELLLAWITCNTCKKIRVNTLSGSLCPDGHGRIMIRVPFSASRILTECRKANALPQAVRVPGFPRSFILEGDLYVRSSAKNSVVQVGYHGNVIRLKPSRRTGTARKVFL